MLRRYWITFTHQKEGLQTQNEIYVFYSTPQKETTDTPHIEPIHIHIQKTNHNPSLLPTFCCDLYEKCNSLL